MNRLTWRFLLIMLAITAVLAIGTVGFTVIDHYPPFDAFYMSLTTLTTVGYAEVHPLSHAGRVFNSFLIFFGVTTIFIAIGAITQTVIEMEFGEAIGKRRNKRMIDKLKDHYIICGFGRVGRGAAAELQHAGVPFVIVDMDRGSCGTGHDGRNAGASRPMPRTTRRCTRSGSSGRAASWRRYRPTPTTCSCCSPRKG